VARWEKLDSAISKCTVSMLMHDICFVFCNVLFLCKWAFGKWKWLNDEATVGQLSDCCVVCTMEIFYPFHATISKNPNVMMK
jgi:hypothetical protein